MNFTLEDENRSVSDYSPGSVNDDEHLLRVVYEPEYIRNGKLILTAIPHKDLVDRGYSTDRDELKNKELMRKRAEAQMQRVSEDRNEKFIVKFRCEDIRKIRLNNAKRELLL